MDSEAESLVTAASSAPHLRRRQLLLGIASAAGLAPALSACGGGAGNEVILRAVNATMDVDSIDVQFSDWRFANQVSRGAIASYFARRRSWADGTRESFEVRRTGASTVLLRDAISRPRGDMASVVVMGYLADLTVGLQLRVIDEDLNRPDGPTVRLRLLHAWPLFGAVDVFVTSADQTLAGLAPTLRLRDYGSLSTPVDVNGGGRLRIAPAGRTDLVLFDSISIGLAIKQAGTLVLAPAPAAPRAVVAVLPQGLPALVLHNSAVWPH